MCKHYFKLVCLAFLVGCTVKVPSISQYNVKELSVLLTSLDRQVPPKEAMLLSQDIYQKTQELTKNFKLMYPPAWHNTLVNVGLREKGLCYHWSDALYTYLNAQDYTSFEFHLLGANINEYFFEHNALAIVAKNKKVEDGLVIDPWRNSGKLYFSRIKDDVSYQWKHRINRGCLL